MNAKQKSKIVVFFFISMAVIVLLVYVGGGFFTSVDFDAGICAGGFDRHLVDTEIYDIEDVLNYELTEEQVQNLMSNFKFKGRKIFTYYTDENGNTVNLLGKKVWYDEYKWEVLE